MAIAPACLDVPPGPTQECVSNASCDTANGEICDDGKCWGNPPLGEFAAVVSPPSSRSTLVPKEIVDLVIHPDGWIDGLVLEKPATLLGRIEAVCAPPLVCDRMSVETTIHVTRPSLFPGGPDFKAVATSEIGSDGPAFEVALPKGTDDHPYTITVIPDGRGDEPVTGMTTAQVLPPMRFTLPVTGDVTRTITLGGTNLPVVDGSLLGPTGTGLSHHRVVALGRWEAGAPLTEVSTVDYTGANGVFQLVLSPGLVGTVEIVAKPYGGNLAPTLHLANVPGSVSSQRTLLQPTGLGVMTSMVLPIRGVDGNGEIIPVSGARVTVTGITDLAANGYAKLTVEGTTNDIGEVTLVVLDGLALRTAYKLEVVPLASSPVGAVYDEPLVLAPIAQNMLLPARVRLRGTVFDAEGHKMKNATVTARPALRFLWSLEDVPQAFLSAIPAATGVTNENGEFVVWVDQTVAGLWGHYDLVFEPALAGVSLERAPLWVTPGIEIPRDEKIDSVSVPDVWLPDAAFVRGEIQDHTGDLVEGAELKIFRVNTPGDACTMALNAPLPCPVPAVLQGRAAADAHGTVELALPR